MAIKIAGSEVINDSKQLTNITGADATTVSSLNTAGLAATADIPTDISDLTDTTSILDGKADLTGATFTGSVTATSFVGDGSQLTGISGGGGSSNDVISINVPQITNASSLSWCKIADVTRASSTSALGNFSFIERVGGVQRTNGGAGGLGTSFNLGTFNVYGYNNAYLQGTILQLHSGASSLRYKNVSTTAAEIWVYGPPSYVSGTGYINPDINFTVLNVPTDLVITPVASPTWVSSASGLTTLSTDKVAYVDYATSAGSATTAASLSGNNVTYLTAGSGISLSANTGSITISATGGGSGGGIAIDSFNYLGSDIRITFTNASDIPAIISGGYSSLDANGFNSDIGATDVAAGPFSYIDSFEYDNFGVPALAFVGFSNIGGGSASTNTVEFA